jgi:hypothetical protein
MSETIGNDTDIDIEKLVRLSKKVDIGDLDLSQAANPLTDEEIHALAPRNDNVGN